MNLKFKKVKRGGADGVLVCGEGLNRIGVVLFICDQRDLSYFVFS